MEPLGNYYYSLRFLVSIYRIVAPEASVIMKAFRGLDSLSPAQLGLKGCNRLLKTSDPKSRNRASIRIHALIGLALLLAPVLKLLGSSSNLSSRVASL